MLAAFAFALSAYLLVFIGAAVWGTRPTQAAASDGPILDAGVAPLIPSASILAVRQGRRRRETGDDLIVRVAGITFVVTLSLAIVLELATIALTGI